jgi:hypothetical protein
MEDKTLVTDSFKLGKAAMQGHTGVALRDRVAVRWSWGGVAYV